MLLPDASVCLLGLINAWETVMVLLVALILYGTRPGSEINKGLGRGIEEFLRASREITDGITNAASEDTPGSSCSDEDDSKQVADPLVIWIAQGFGSGLAPKAPGTFGSMVGVVMFLVMTEFSCAWAYIIATILLAVSSIWICGAAERILNQHDPGSVVLDEIVAMPVCFLGWVGWATWDRGGMPGQQYFLDRWPVILAGFALFRLLDVTKPGPIGRIQNLPGGLGVTADDILAAVGVNLLLLPFFPWW